MDIGIEKTYNNKKVVAAAAQSLQGASLSAGLALGLTRDTGENAGRGVYSRGRAR